MTLPRTLIVLLALAVAGAGLTSAQDQPLAAGSDGVPVPKKKKHVQPVYPPEALAQGIRGIVILDLVIDTEGRVAETHIIRSIPGLDEAALVAARQWRYEPVKVNGKPVSVRLTVPITFALKLPEMTRQAGIPELRQGVSPPWPENARGSGGGVAVADVTLEPDGRIGLARIIEGQEPWSTSLLQALRTWRFRPPQADATVSFRVAAEFTPGGDKGRVALRLSGLRESQFFGGPETAEMSPPSDAAPPPAPPPDASEVKHSPEAEVPRPEPQTAETAGAAPETTQHTGPQTAPEGAPTSTVEAKPPGEAPEHGRTAAPPREGSEAEAPPTPQPPPTAVAEARPPEAAPPATPGSASPPPPPGPESPPATPAEAVAPPDEGPPAAAASAPQGAGNETAEGQATVAQAAPPPPVEVLSVAPPPLPPENGISAIRGVELEPGVPDLTRGRRPVSPPFARMQGASGEVTVEFSVSGGGVTTVQRVEGPEILQPAARGAVESWVFRRTRADRAYLVAKFTYDDDLASAIVAPQSQ